jgi:hypothetical protein
MNNCPKYDQCINHINCDKCIDQDLYISKGDNEK